MRKITITCPSKTAKWKLASGHGGTPKSYDSIGPILKAFRQLVVPQLREKTCVRVKYDSTYDNTTIPSFNSHYLAYATYCFLEDYLTPQTLTIAEKKWTKWVKGGGAQW